MQQEDRAKIINEAIEKYFRRNTSVSKVMAKDLMPLFIKEGIFEKDHRSGLPIRNLLRDLDKANQLNLIPSVLAERKLKNTNWYFLKQGEKSHSTVRIQKNLNKTSSIAKKSKIKDRDEDYIIGLCDEVLKLKSSRQHKFNFLLGDAGTKLPVDAYYESLNLVIEYRERQHTEPVKHFDKPDKMTVSGVHRGEQRKIYDERRRKVLPENGINFIEISFSDFNFDSSKRIIKNKSNDLEKVKSLLEKNI